MKGIFQKSIVAKIKINNGDVLSMDNLAFKKPGTGIPASEIDSFIGKSYNGEAQLDDMICRKWVDE